MMIKRYITSTLLMLLCVGISTANAYKVYGHTGHVVTSDMMYGSSWNTVAAGMHAFYVGTPTFRELSASQKAAILANTSVRDCVAEAEYEYISPSDPNNNITAATAAGLQVSKIMVYNEGVYGSTLTISRVNEVKSIYPTKLLFVNIRVWAPNFPVGMATQMDVVSHSNVAGFTYEFGATTDLTKLSNVAQAIIWAVDHGKRVLLLTPPESTLDRYNNSYLLKYQAMRTHLRNLVGTSRFNSPLLGFVPANYPYTPVGNLQGTYMPICPEDASGVSYYNSTLGVSKWLINNQ